MNPADERRKAKAAKDRADYEARKARRAREAADRAEAKRLAEEQARLAAVAARQRYEEEQRAWEERRRAEAAAWETGRPERERKVREVREKVELQQRANETSPRPRRIATIGNGTMLALLLALAASNDSDR